MNSHIFRLLTGSAVLLAVTVYWFGFLGPACISSKSDLSPLLWSAATVLGLALAISVAFKKRKRTPPSRIGDKE